MKKFLSVLLVYAIACTTFFSATYALDNGSVKVFITISDANGRLALAHIAVNVTDTDSDGTLTINDALFCAHEAFYNGGADAGYSTKSSQMYGMSLIKLWGIENNEGFGYYVNNKSAWSLLDTVYENDYIAAFVYTDIKGWSDAYTFFEVTEKSVKAYTKFSLTLNSLTYDAETWELVEVPIQNAAITVDGKTTTFTTDKNGTAIITLTSSGIHTLSAVSESSVIVPPVCIVSVEKGNLLSAVKWYFNHIRDILNEFFKWLIK